MAFIFISVVVFYSFFLVFYAILRSLSHTPHMYVLAYALGSCIKLTFYSFGCNVEVSVLFFFSGWGVFLEFLCILSLVLDIPMEKTLV